MLKTSLITALVLMPFLVQAQTIQCNTAEEKALCQAEYQKTLVEISQVEGQLSVAQNQSSSLKRDISILDAKIKVAQLNIRAKNLLIEGLGKDIRQKQDHISSLEDRIIQGKEALAQILRKTDEIDSYTLPEIFLSQNTLSDFLHGIDDLESVQSGLKDTFVQIRSDKAETETAKDALDKRRNTEIDARYAIQQEQNSIERNQDEKNRLLAISKNSEKAYQSDLSSKRSRAAQIRAALFSLRDAAAIPFGDALKYANEASARTGVRPAFVLAILTQESSLGKNVGLCYLSDPNTGIGINAKTGASVFSVMKPGRDTNPFFDIMKSLGGDPLKTPVSCPLSIGWGGAMGPAQFIPSTWVLLKNRIASILGISIPADPWNPEHAIVASSLYLSDLGARSGSYTAERNAACKYYSGSPCGIRGNTSYGNNVMYLASNIQRTMIDPLQGL